MQITFDTSAFAKAEKSLTNVLHYLRRHGCFKEGVYPEIEAITCRTPSAALRYVRYFANHGISAASEAIFLKNPTIGVQYLKMVGKREFSDPTVQKRFRRKFKSNAALAYQWAVGFNERLTEEEEEVFRKDVAAACDYAKRVIRGKFSESVHGMLVLASFKDLSSYHKQRLSEYIKFSEGK